MKNSNVESILLLNRFMTQHQSNHNCCYFLRKIIDSKINYTISKKPSFMLFFWMIGFIFAGRSGLWS